MINDVDEFIATEELRFLERTKVTTESTWSGGFNFPENMTSVYLNKSNLLEPIMEDVKEVYTWTVLQQKYISLLDSKIFEWRNVPTIVEDQTVTEQD